MSGEEDGRRDLARLVVARCGLLEATGDPFGPYRLVDADGVVVGPVAVYLRELQACGRPATTQRSYGRGPGSARREGGGQSGHREAGAGGDLCGRDPGAFGERAACLLRPAPGGWDGADGEPVPAVAEPAGRPGECPPQPGGALP